MTGVNDVASRWRTDGWIPMNFAEQLYNSITDVFYSLRSASSQNIIQSSRHNILQSCPNLGHIETVADAAPHALIAQHCGQINITFPKLLAYWAGQSLSLSSCRCGWLRAAVPTRMSGASSLVGWPWNCTGWGEDVRWLCDDNKIGTISW